MNTGTSDSHDTPNSAALTSRLALGGALLMLCLVCVSAYLRLSAAGLDCQPWPECYAQATHETQPHPVARLTHRLLASAVGIVVLLLVFASFVRRAQRPVQFWMSVALLALTAALALLGRATPGAVSALVSSSNLLGGLALLALMTWIALDAPAAAGRRSGGGRRLQLLSYAAVGLTVIQLVSGALLSTTYAATACPVLTGCGAAAPAAALHLLHRLLGMVLLLADGVLAVGLLRKGGSARILAGVLLALPLIQVAVGVMMATSQFPLWAALLHNLVAALLIATAVAAVQRTSRH